MSDVVDVRPRPPAPAPPALPPGAMGLGERVLVGGFLAFWVIVGLSIAGGLRRY